MDKYYGLDGTELQLNEDGFYRSETDKYLYRKTEAGTVVPIKDPSLGGELVTTEFANCFKSEYDNSMYLLKDNQLIPLISPEHGGSLYPTENGFFKSEYDNNKITYRLTKENKIQAALDPYCKGTLEPQENGLFYSPYIHKNFMYDEEKGAYIPTYIPDDTEEEAHIEGDFLVGNESGRKFPINEKGQVAILYDPYTNKETFEQRKKRQFHMSQKEIDERLRQDQERNKRDLKEAIEKTNPEAAYQMQYIEETKRVLKDIQNKLENNEPLTNEDLANAEAISKGEALPNKNIKQGKETIVSQTNK